MLPPILVALAFLIAVVASLVFMAYVSWKGSKPTDFFTEAVSGNYDMDLPEAEINAYYDLKEKLQTQYAPESLDEEEEVDEDPENTPPKERWTLKLPDEERGNLQKALMQRLVCSIERLDKVQRDKPGNWKLWREKLVSEHYWESLQASEKMVGDEIDHCVAESDEIQPGWREVIFRQAVQCWRMKKQHETEKKEVKKVKVDQKKEVIKAEKAVINEAKKEIEDKLKQEKLAQKAMEQLLKEEEQEAKKKGGSAKAKPKARNAPVSGSKKK